jgi:hypothetical protein
LSGFLEIILRRMKDIDESLGISVDQRKPGALDLNHDPVPLLEGVKYVLKLERDLSDFVGHEGHRFG